jgi:hypothetical protein
VIFIGFSPRITEGKERERIEDRKIINYSYLYSNLNKGDAHRKLSYSLDKEWLSSICKVIANQKL